jgi:hypothetical protein
MTQAALWRESKKGSATMSGTKVHETTRPYHDPAEDFDRNLSDKGKGYRAAFNRVSAAQIDLKCAGHRKNFGLIKRLAEIEVELRKVWDKEYEKARAAEAEERERREAEVSVGDRVFFPLRRGGHSFVRGTVAEILTSGYRTTSLRVIADDGTEYKTFPAAFSVGISKKAEDS